MTEPQDRHSVHQTEFDFTVTKSTWSGDMDEEPVDHGDPMLRPDHPVMKLLAEGHTRVELYDPRQEAFVTYDRHDLPKPHDYKMGTDEANAIVELATTAVLTTVSYSDLPREADRIVDWVEAAVLEFGEQIGAELENVRSHPVREMIRLRAVADFTEYVTEQPHSRACGIIPHPHGPRCSPDCPTCGGSEEEDA